MTIRSTLLVAAAVLASVVVTAQTAPSNVKKLGNAIRQYQDEHIQAVIAYEYSHRYHDGAWLLVDAAVRTTDRLVFDRNHFALVTPDEKTIRLASESRFVNDAPQITRIRQNASIWTRDLNTYFNDKNNSAKYRLFALPGDGVVTDSIVTERYGAAFTTLYFESPAGRWADGTYSLSIDNGRVRVGIPIELK